MTTDKIADGAITTAKFNSSALAPDADELDGIDSAAFASAGKAYSKAQSDARFLGINAKAADSEKLDGLDSSAFALAGSLPDTYTKHAASHIGIASHGSVNVFCDAGDRALGGGYNTQ